MRKFGLIGYPLGHSFSKKFFTEKFIREHLDDCSYELFPLKSIEVLPSLLRQESSLSGLNVTIPFKSSVIGFLDSISEEAAAIGAVNVIRISRNAGKVVLSGFNSDVTGFHDSLIPVLEKRRGSAIVLGTGGSSKAVCHVLKNLGMSLHIVSRNSGKGHITYGELAGDMIKQACLIVNTTPLGMFPDVNSKPPIDYNALTQDHILYDLVYNPELTAFLKEGEQRGCRIINGLRMLTIQAERSWEIWNDEKL